MTKKITIGLLWQTLSSGNLGVSALAHSQLQLVRDAAQRCGAEVQFKEFCHSEVAGQIENGVAFSDPMSLRGILLGRSKFLKQLRSCDFVLDIGEGDSFSDLYGVKRFLLQSSSKLLALALTEKLILSPQTIGPFESQYSRITAKWLLRRTHKVFTRDAPSATLVRTFGVACEELTDVAFALPYSSRPKLGQFVHVGMNVSGLLFNGGYTGTNQFGLAADYRRLTYNLLNRLCSSGSFKVHLIPHVVGQNGYADNDLQVNAELAQRYPSAVQAGPFSSPMDAKTYISSLDFFMGARMHACIAAFGAGVPVVPLAYSRKFSGLFESLGYTRVVDLRFRNEEEVVSATMDALQNHELLQQEVVACHPEITRRLDEYVSHLATLISECRNS